MTYAMLKAMKRNARISEYTQDFAPNRFYVVAFHTLYRVHRISNPRHLEALWTRDNSEASVCFVVTDAALG